VKILPMRFKPFYMDGGKTDSYNETNICQTFRTHLICTTKILCYSFPFKIWERKKKRQGWKGCIKKHYTYQNERGSQKSL